MHCICTSGELAVPWKNSLENAGAVVSWTCDHERAGLECQASRQNSSVHYCAFPNAGRELEILGLAPHIQSFVFCLFSLVEVEPSVDT